MEAEAWKDRKGEDWTLFNRCPFCGERQLTKHAFPKSKGWRCGECKTLLPRDAPCPGEDDIYRIAAELREQRFDARRSQQLCTEADERDAMGDGWDEDEFGNMDD